ncbi:SUMF1/EgtB/PvdO family nonheme iron enzyme [Streptomyces sp. B-S-A8]|uniref:SUMF1/EgtB/PvdO family nonheme iron enzyme n=1 Tax=Streptomyces solicavernae TaxID=3043614 RepID=A0ABT6S0E2_9ACTN|nr:SUMF1/EgtB/PvdO family nonheme iron enzyme [Streptomyces sp. B-S-A8]MDI3390148.1 SUMF1/EgtB/PvdO family nonheme iron enzyme [Streptomyces sp. B-S-A8]
MPLVTNWTGKEVRALRTAARMSAAALAERIGVSERAVTKWETENVQSVRMENQAALDTLLAQANADVQGRFVGLLTSEPNIPPQQIVEQPVFSGKYVRHPKDGKPMACVAAGIYLSGEDGEPEFVDEFYIDAHPVTNADYARFVVATGHHPPKHWPEGSPLRELYDHPVVEVSWLDASAYADWAGKRLPSASEWEKAARGTAGKTFPWGEQPTPAKCNVRETGIESTTPVSKYHSGASPYGVYDMVGNVWEWLRTPADRKTGTYQLKGSAFSSFLFQGAPSSYNEAADFMQDDDTGFRCTAAPEQLDEAA